MGRPSPRRPTRSLKPPPRLSDFVIDLPGLNVELDHDASEGEAEEGRHHVHQQQQVFGQQAGQQEGAGLVNQRTGQSRGAQWGCSGPSSGE